MSSLLLTKQRGIYSQTIEPHNAQQFKVVHHHQKQQICNGPSQDIFLITRNKQISPPAISYNHFKIFQDIFTQQKSGKVWIKENQIVTPVNPKVLQPFDPIPGQVPRKVAIERRKKLYSSFNINKLLAKQNINFNQKDEYCQWLSLNMFDDKSYDDLQPYQWLQRQYDQQNVFHPLTGRGLYKSPSGQYRYKKLVIHSYDQNQQKFEGYWTNSQQPLKFERLLICFDAEDPRKYVERLKTAYRERKYTDALIRYNNIINNMPLDDLTELDSQQKKRIIHMLSRFKDLEGINFTIILSQINNDFKRTMCKIIFDQHLKSNPTQLIYLINRLPPEPKEKEVPEFGMKQLESSKGAKQIYMYTYKQKYPLNPKKFHEIHKEFCFATLFGQKAVIKALQDIRKKCNYVYEMPLFQFKINEAMHLDHFKHMQQNIQNQTVYFLKGTWIPQMIKTIRSEFTEVGKGWFNMKQINKITYDFGKLKKFLTVVRLMMQDTIYDMIRDNHNRYFDYICSFIPKKVEITSSFQVKNHFNQPPKIQGKYQPFINHFPLFQVQLIKTADNQITYNTKETNFIHVVMFSFSKALEQMAKIPDLQPSILADLYKSQKLETYVKSPIKPKQKPIDPDPNERPKKYPDENKWLWELYQQLQFRIKEAIKPLNSYLQTLDRFKSKLKVNPDEYVKSIEMDENQREAQSIKEQILNLQKENQRLKFEFPEKIHVGIFEIHCRQVLNHLQQINNSLIKNLINLMGKMVKQKLMICFNSYDAINKKLNQEPKNIQKLTELNNYIHNLPVTMNKIKADVEYSFDIIEILESFSYRYTVDQFRRRWMVFGYPKEIQEVAVSREKVLEKLKLKFLEELKQKQKSFQSNILNLQQTIQDFYHYQDIQEYSQVYQNVVIVNTDINKYIEQARVFNNHQYLFGNMELTDYSKINQMSKDFLPYNNLWTIVNDWIQKEKEWMDGDWRYIQVGDSEKFMEDSIKMLNGVMRYMKDKEIKNVYKIAQGIKASMDKFRPKVPLLNALKKKGIKDTHINQISELINKKVIMDNSFTFRQALDMGMMNYVEKIVQIGDKAGKQYQIECILNNMIKEWEYIQFEIVPFKTIKEQKLAIDKEGTYIIRSYQDISNKLDQHIVNTQAIQFSPYKKPFQKQIIRWDKTLRHMSDLLDELGKFQQKWIYLQPIFDSQDIAKQLPQQSKRFKTVDHTWRYSMNQIKSILNVLKCITQEGLLQRIRQANKNLQIIEKELKNYLQKKRQKFARFYFLSNGELLEILSQAKQPLAVQPHLKKVFENINRIQFKGQKKIVAMLSQQKQKIPFVKPIDPNKKNVEDWMGQVQTAMRKSIRNVLIQGLQSYDKIDRNDWVLNNAGQVVLNASQTAWTRQVEQAIVDPGRPSQQEEQVIESGLQRYYTKSQNQLMKLVTLVRKITDKQHKTTIGALIVIDVHAKDVVDKLRKLKIENIGAFQWISQLRYYFQEDFWVKCIQTNFPYGYQYLGNTLRLVITPLTDKCYMTLMSALKLNLGGAPAGPAGTGKTQTTKDLAKALAKQCVVFNCSDTMDYLMVGKFFKGLASSGAWACFDEFNRINIEVLSVVAQQLLVLFGQKAKGTTVVEFEQSTIKLNPTFSVFITMNPGYAGRTQLPDNLKALFRSVAMMVPDYAMIGEILLYSFGFESGRDLARKMVTTFKLSSEQLSSQDHYDYGMRAVRSVINAAGLLKMSNTQMNEEQLLLRALQDVNVPKFLKDDLPLFSNIISDLFPRVQKPTYSYGNLQTAIQNKCRQLGLQKVKNFIDKILQLYDTIQVRHGLMLVGLTGGGKTSNYKVLSAALTSLKNQGFYKVNTHVLNPKSITMGQLYGQFSQQSHQWTQGILACMVRQTVRDQSGQKHWIMFDGPVDALWIQSMNTVLDDNKKLCLNSGQILVLTQHITMMFQVQDLEVASPATVSRCGMVYMQPIALGLKSLLDSWLESLPVFITSRKKKIIPTLEQLFNAHLDQTINFKQKNCKQIIPIIQNNQLQSCQRILNCFFQDYLQNDFKRVTNQDLEYLQNYIEAFFSFAFIWSFMVTVDHKGRQQFNYFWRKRNTSFPFPNQLTIYDYFFDKVQSKWQQWKILHGTFQILYKQQFHQIVIPTTDSTRNKYIMKLLITNKIHILTPGPTGTGKTLNAFSMMTTQLTETYQYIAISFSAQTSANQTQDTIDSRIDKRTKRKYGPPVGKRCIVFIDDFNMPKKQEFGAQPPIQLVRQFLDHKGWYNRKQLMFMQIQDIIMMCAMGPPGGGRNVITARCVRHFNVLTYTELEHNVESDIFSKLCKHFFKKFQENINQLIPEVVENVLKTYQKIREVFLPTPSKSHYTFNLRDLGKVFQGICAMYSKYTESIYLFRIVHHQICRVFHDRLTTNEDRKKLIELINQIIPQQYLQNLYNNQDRIIFCDFLKGRQDQRPYMFVEDLSRFIEIIQKFQDDFVDAYSKTTSNGKKSSRLVLFLDACQHIARICRILHNPKGNALLLGVGGSGRQSLSRLAIFLCDYRFDQIQVIKGYSIRTWRDHIKGLLMKVGIENRPITFVFVDTQIIHEQMMQDLNNILNSGDVTGIYIDKDLEDIMTACKQDCLKAGLQPTKMNIFQIYLNRVTKNLHVVMAMSPIGEAFTTRLRMFPALVNCCTIDWFSQWPEEALIGVGTGQLLEYEEQIGIQGLVDPLVNMFNKCHKFIEHLSRKFKNQLRRSNYVTPTSYLELINLYRVILKQKNYELKRQINRLTSGLQKLQNANQEVEKMRIELKEKKPVLILAQEQTNKMMEALVNDKAQAKQVQKRVMKESEIATEATQKALELQKQVQAKVQESKRKLDQVASKMQQIKPTHISELKTVSIPTPATSLVLQGACYLLKEKIIVNTQKLTGKREEDPFATAKTSFLKMDAKQLVDRLVHFNVEKQVDDKIIEKLQANVVYKPIFTEENAAKASLVIKYMFYWVDACYTYYIDWKNAEPLRIKQRQVQAQVQKKVSKLNQVKKLLQQTNKRIDILQKTYDEKAKEIEKLTADIESCKVKLDRAQKLTDGLKDQKERWSVDVKNLQKSEIFLAGNSALAAAMVSYSGPFTSTYRQQCENTWINYLDNLQIKRSSNLTFKHFLGDQVKIQAWNIAGLPKDDTSIQNGIIIDKTRRWPLMIDPQVQANKFLKNILSNSETGYEILKINNPSLMKELQIAIQFGKWFLVENVGTELDPSLDPILLQQVQKSSSGEITISLGKQKNLVYHSNFRFFMTTTLANPHYSPETSAKVTIINFAITKKGLQQQMLANVVALEAPNLQSKKNEIVRKNAFDKKELINIEDQILKYLTDAENIEVLLRDQHLINKLQNSKKVTTEINQRVKDSKITEAEIDRNRESYRAVAFRASLLFFTINDLCIIDPMYQYSLQWFVNLFRMSVENAQKSQVLEDRLVNLNNYFTNSLFQNICNSLFEMHKLLFSFLLTERIMQGDNNIDYKEWRYLLTGPMGQISIKKNPTVVDEVGWISQSSWPDIYRNIYGMSKLKGLEYIEPYFINCPNDFRVIYESNNPGECQYPQKLNQLTEFQKIIFIKSLRTDKMIQEIQKWISNKLGPNFIVFNPLEIQKCFADSIAITPLIFVLSPGSDPVSDFLKFAEQKGMIRRFESISLGQGQGQKAKRLIYDANTKGSWVLLQNCHLSTSWMPHLEQIVEQLNDNSHKDFRLWLTSMPSQQFPISVLQNGVKMTIQPPKGIKSNLLRSYMKISNRELNNCKKPEIFKKLLFSFCLFHAIVQERRRFGPIGWNIFYQFTNQDLDVCKRQLKLLLDQYQKVPYQVINYLGAQINYGGRVTDDKDVRLIITILKGFINPDVLKEGYKYSSASQYYSPPVGNQSNYLQFIEGLPRQAPSELFGLHANATITNFQNQSLFILETVLSMQPRTSSKTEKSRQQTIEEIALYIQEKIPQRFNIEQVSKEYPTDYNQSMNTVLLQEVIRYDKLLVIMKQTLKQLKKALKGFVVMSQDLQNVGNSLYDNQVPSIWSAKGFLSLKPLSLWTQDLKERVQFLNRWIRYGVPKVFWIAGLFFPQAFITGTLQNYARKYQIEIDKLSFDFNFLKQRNTQIYQQPLDGCYVYGVFLEGCTLARPDKKKSFIKQPKPKQLYSQLPVMHLIPIQDRQPPTEGIEKLPDIYYCPLYKVVSRKGTLSTTGHSTNFVMYIQLPSKQNQDLWIKAGVAAFLSLRY